MPPHFAKASFSLSSYRHLRRFIGELTATAAGNEIAVRSTSDFLAEASSGDWEFLGKCLNIKVGGLESPRLMISCSRLHVVSLYSGWDGFIRSLRSEYQKLFGMDWRHSEGDTPFDEIYRHSPVFVEDLKQRINPNRQITIEYYRKVRNAIVHPAASTASEAEAHFRTHTDAFAEVRKQYGMHSPPREHNSMTFFDVKMLARLLLDVGRAVSESFDPGDARLLEIIPLPRWGRLRGHDEEGYRNRILGYLRTEFGLATERACKIVSDLMAL